ncbi:unnamed protein product [Protopolystoma xenopodis]|uniref:Uncharacterized protein n=1 Tax=Protopolystoma xenopodis TaxID=117903 RepID=A0A3S5BBB1_9PLAT|nr:unnamed protein product [Protopolystoma xenopodis]
MFKACVVKEPSLPVPSSAVLAALQDQAEPEEKERWLKAGCTQTPSGDVFVWHLGDCPVAPRALLPYLVAASHDLTHTFYGGICDVVSGMWFAPGFSSIAAKYV